MTNERRPHPNQPQRFEEYRPAQDRQGQSRPNVRGPQPRRAPQRPNRAPKRGLGFPVILISVVALIGIAAGAIALAAVLIPTDFIRDQIIAAVKDETGRDLTIAGPTRFTVYPSLGVTLRDVSLSGASEMAATEPFASMRALEVRVALLPLLTKDIRVETLVLHDPVVNLWVDKSGRKSWNFDVKQAASAATLDKTQLAQKDNRKLAAGLIRAGAVTSPSAGTNMSVQDLKLDDVRIVNGTLNYRDDQSGTREQIKAVNANVSAVAMAAPLTANGNLVWKERQVQFDGSLTSVEAVLAERPAKIAVAVTAPDVSATFEGTASLHGAIHADGTLKANSPSLRNLLSWFGTQLPPSRGFGPFEATGFLRGNAQAVTYSGAEIGLDGAIARGDVAIKTSGARPHLKANLKLTELDLNMYTTTGTSAAAPMRETPAPATPNANAPPASIEDLLSREPDPTRVRGYTKRSGWSEEPFDLKTLGLVDADAKLSVGRLLVSDMKVGQTELDVKLKNRVLKTTIDEVRLYEGRGRGFLTADATKGNSMRVAANLAFDGISAEPFLRDSAGFDRLSGRGKLTVVLAGEGPHQQRIVETLAGKVNFNFSDGAIRGVNLARMLRAVGQGRITDLASAPTEKTDFSQMSASWNVAGGVAQNQDLILQSPLLRVTGNGNVNVPAKQVDYLVRPRLVSDLSGQGGSADSVGLEVPVRVRGSWDNPSIAPDLSGLVSDPTKAVDTIRDIGKKLKGKNAGELLEGIIGGGGNGNDGGGTSGAKELLEGLFGR